MTGDNVEIVRLDRPKRHWGGGGMGPPHGIKNNVLESFYDIWNLNKYDKINVLIHIHNLNIHKYALEKSKFPSGHERGLDFRRVDVDSADENLPQNRMHLRLFVRISTTLSPIQKITRPEFEFFSDEFRICANWSPRKTYGASFAGSCAANAIRWTMSVLRSPRCK